MYEFLVRKVGTDGSGLGPETLYDVVVGYSILAECIEQQRI